MATVQPHNDDHVDGLAEQANGLSLDEKGVNGHAGQTEYVPETASLGTALASDPDTMRETERPSMPQEPSRSYIKPIPIITTYEQDLPDNASVSKRRSIAGSVKASSVKAPSVKAQSIRDSNREQENAPYARPPSRSASVRSRQGASVGEVVSPERQRRLQGVSLQDNGSVRPASAFGHRPQPNLLSVAEDGEYHSRAASRAGQMDRSATVLSRANTLGRNGTLSRAANGGTVGSRRGAFGRGAGASIGTQPEEVLGRDDIHARAELSERILDDATLRRLATMEKKDAKRLSKVLKSEGKAEAKAVKGSIKELERLSRLQKEAAAAERKSQLRLSKYTSKEHKARLRFLKEKERYEKIEGDLRNAENDYEERRDHAAGLTAQVAEKTQELDDLRGQKAADDREREVKLLALKNPGHS